MRISAPLRARNTPGPGRAADLYFLHNPALDIIKIGVAVSVGVRHHGLEMACGVPLTLLAVVRGGSSYERDLLEVFAESRLLGEWFRPTDALLDLIARPETILEVIAYAWPGIEARRAAVGA